MRMILESPSPSPDTLLATTMNRMTRLLKTVRPASDAEALRMLRAVFPRTSLKDRIAALARHSGEKEAQVS